MLYFDYPIVIDTEGVRIYNKDDPNELDLDHFFERYAILPGECFSIENHPECGIWFRRLKAEEYDDFHMGNFCNR